MQQEIPEEQNTASKMDTDIVSANMSSYETSLEVQGERTDAPTTATKMDTKVVLPISNYGKLSFHAMFFLIYIFCFDDIF